MQSFERLRNRLPVIDHQVIIDAQRRNLVCNIEVPPHNFLESALQKLPDKLLVFFHRHLAVLLTLVYSD
jgi:hypothetical protein